MIEEIFEVVEDSQLLPHITLQEDLPIPLMLIMKIKLNHLAKIIIHLKEVIIGEALEGVEVIIQIHQICLNLLISNQDINRPVCQQK